MFILSNDNQKIEVLTIEELYNAAKTLGIEKNGIGIFITSSEHCNEDGDCFEYCEQISPLDIEIGNYYHNGKPIYPMIWLNPFKVE